MPTKTVLSHRIFGILTSLLLLYKYCFSLLQVKLGDNTDSETTQTSNWTLYLFWVVSLVLHCTSFCVAFLILNFIFILACFFGLTLYVFLCGLFDFELYIYFGLFLWSYIVRLFVWPFWFWTLYLFWLVSLVLHCTSFCVAFLILNFVFILACFFGLTLYVFLCGLFDCFFDFMLCVYLIGFIGCFLGPTF